MNQILTSLTGDDGIKLIATKNIIGPEWTFYKGQRLRGVRGKDKTWRIWPMGKRYAFIIGVPSGYVKHI